MKIYTKTGDKGQTSLVGGKRVSKCCTRLESYGTVDELNSHIGLLRTYCESSNDNEFLSKVQATLFVIGSHLATDTTTTTMKSSSIVTPDMVESIEKEIDAIDAQLPPLTSFILPSGCRGAAEAHVCRTVCRRAERCILALVGEGAEVDNLVTAYINRLSDYFFLLARKLNQDTNTQETLWQ